MALPPPLTHLPIALHDRGFYEGFNRIVTVGAKTLVVLIILWAAVFPERAGALLSAVNATVLANFGAWYVYVTTFFVLVCLGLAIWPATAKIRLGLPGRAAGVLQLLLVLDDVRRRHRHRHADLLDRRADLSLLDQPRRHPRVRGRRVGRDRALGLQVVVPALGPDALGHLRDHRHGARVLQLFPRPAADHPLRPHADLRRGAQRPDRARGRHRRGDRDGARRRRDHRLRRQPVLLRPPRADRRRLDDVRGRADQHDHDPLPRRRDGRLDPVGGLGRRSRHQVAVEHQHGPDLLPARLLPRVRRDALRVQGARLRALRLSRRACPG